MRRHDVLATRALPPVHEDQPAMVVRRGGRTGGVVPHWLWR